MWRRRRQRRREWGAAEEVATPEEGEGNDKGGRRKDTEKESARDCTCMKASYRRKRPSPFADKEEDVTTIYRWRGNHHRIVHHLVLPRWAAIVCVRGDEECGSDRTKSTIKPI